MILEDLKKIYRRQFIDTAILFLIGTIALIATIVFFSIGVSQYRIPTYVVGFIAFPALVFVSVKRLYRLQPLREAIKAKHFSVATDKLVRKEGKHCTTRHRATEFFYYFGFEKSTDFETEKFAEHFPILHVPKLYDEMFAEASNGDKFYIISIKEWPSVHIYNAKKYELV